MSIFTRIKEAIFGQAHARPAPAPAPAPHAPATATAAPRPAPAPEASQVDIENSLDSMPGADHLNWRTSIVDLMKLIGVDSDYESRKALAHELGRADYAGSAEDNVWLHKVTMQELAKNGGRVPAEFLD